MTSSAHGSTGHRYDAVLRLLDHQIVGPGGEMLGNVDDLQLSERDGRLSVIALVVGPGGLAQRLPGRLGAWTGAIWRRLDPDPHPRPTTVPLRHVTSIGSALSVDDEGARVLLGAAGLELWLRRYVISRVPGAKGTGDQIDPEGTGAAASVAGGTEHLSAESPDPTTLFASALIGSEVRDHEDVVIGVICELRCTGRPPGRRQAELPVTHFQYTQHLAGSELGYAADPQQGPRLIRSLVRRWHRDDRVVAVTDARLHVGPPGSGSGPGSRELFLRVGDASRHRHPHDVPPDGT
jgi:sporulation protein YlmC with PRC-barrel domain